MKIDIGMPMHGASDSVLKALKCAKEAATLLGADVRVIIADDFSPPGEVTQVKRGAITGLGLDLDVIHLSDLIEGPNPNLARGVAELLRAVRWDADYYLNLESDVMLHVQTLQKLVHAIERSQIPWAFPLQLTPEGDADFIFWNGGIVPRDSLPPHLSEPGRPKWCSLSCLLMTGVMARDKTIRPDPFFKLWCADTDYTCALAQKYGRPLYYPLATVTHHGHQSSQQGQGKYDYLIPTACKVVDAKWIHYLPGGPF
jgi:GT2 family glycosyltransferase